MLHSSPHSVVNIIAARPVHPIREMFQHDLPVRVAASLPGREPQLGRRRGGVEGRGHGNLKLRK